MGRQETAIALGAPGGPAPQEARRLLEPVERAAPGITTVARPTVAGPDLLELTGEVLPRLRELGADVLEVVDRGEPVDYRETSGEPVIAFEADDPGGEGEGGDGGADGYGGKEAGLDQATDWLDLRVVVTVDGHDVALARILAALKHDEPYVVLPDGLLLRTDDPALLRLAEAVRAAPEMRDRACVDGDRVRVGRSDLALWAELSELGVVDAQADRWVASVRALVGFRGLPEVEPVGVVSDLRSYQRDGFRWLSFLRDCGLGGILADDMGLGKTLQARP